MSEALKPCPFCGESYAKFENMTSVWNDNKTMTWVVCGGCGSEGSESSTSKGAVENWNLRADLAGLPEGQPVPLSEWQQMEADNARLRAEVERLKQSAGLPEELAKIVRWSIGSGSHDAALAALCRVLDWHEDQQRGGGE